MPKTMVRYFLENGQLRTKNFEVGDPDWMLNYVHEKFDKHEPGSHQDIVGDYKIITRFSHKIRELSKPAPKYFWHTFVQGPNDFEEELGEYSNADDATMNHSKIVAAARAGKLFASNVVFVNR